MGDKLLNMLISEEIMKECKEKGWHYREVFIAGMETKRGMPKMLERINELEEGNAKLQRGYTRMWQEFHPEVIK
jgi:hypothetical protein